MTNDHWRDYWRNPVTGSFGDDDPVWYREHVLPRWRQLFSDLADGSRILDVATGNGAVTRLALETAATTGKHFDIDAIDRVPTRPLEGVSLLPPAPLERVQPITGHYDLITAQFGLEYADPRKSLPLLAAALKPAGRVFVIAHHVDSVISHNSREELAQYRSLLQDFPVFERMEKLIRIMGEVRSPADRARLQDNPEAQKARLALNRSIARLTARHPKGIAIAEVLRQTRHPFQQGLGTPVNDRIHFLRRVRQQALQARQRLADQLDAALDPSRLKRLDRISADTGLKAVHSGPIHDQHGHLLAWELQFVRP